MRRSRQFTVSNRQVSQFATIVILYSLLSRPASGHTSSHGGRGRIMHGNRWRLTVCVAFALAAVPVARAKATVLMESNTIVGCQGAGSDCTNTVFLSTDLPNDITPFIGGSIAGANPALAD